MTSLGSAIVVFSDFAYCDTKHEHEINVVSDGVRAYAFSPGPFGGDVEAVGREGSTLTVQCPVLLVSEEKCHGEVTFDLADKRWTASEDAIATLEKFGSGVEV